MSHALQTLAANILDHPWLILIFAAIGFIQWLAKKGKSSENVSEAPPPSPPPEPLPRNNPQSEEERIRRFLEALGQPRGAQPPPPVARRTTVRPTVTHVPPPLRSPLPPLKTVPPPLPTAVEPPPMPRQPEPQLRKPIPASEPSFEIRRPGEADDPSRSSGKVAQPDLSTLAGRLKTMQSLRDAIVLREIFGPPRSFQPIDLTSSL